MEDVVNIPKVPQRVVLGRFAFGSQTAFFNWYNPVRAHRVVMVSKIDPYIQWRVSFRLVWWTPSQLIPSVIKYG